MFQGQGCAFVVIGNMNSAFGHSLFQQPVSQNSQLVELPISPCLDSYFLALVFPFSFPDRPPFYSLCFLLLNTSVGMIVPVSLSSAFTVASIQAFVLRDHGVLRTNPFSGIVSKSISTSLLSTLAEKTIQVEVR